MPDILSLSSRLIRVARRIPWTRTANGRARLAGVVVGPENFCFAPQPSWGVIIDAGVGRTPTFAPWIQRHTGAFVVLCDPTPKHLPGLRKWAQEHERTVLLEYAVARETGLVAFFESEEEESGSIDGTHTNRGKASRMVQVQGLALGDLLHEAGRHGEISLVKLDTEGAEFGIFSAPSTLRESLLACPQWLVEFHPVPQTGTHILAVFRIRRYFAALGFRSFSPNGTDYLFFR